MTGLEGHATLIGQRLGRYLITSSLGRGGMAEVFRASDDELDREVAIKVVSPIYGSEGQFLERFKREARLIAQLEHPNILPIYDTGKHQGLPYLVMQLVRGGSLADRLSGQPLDPGRVVAWVHDLAAALDAAHVAGVLHRDVKPGNVLLGTEERALLADFGIARLCDATRLTRTGTVVGTPVYMAPEVAAGKSAAAAADSYSLAVMTYEMLAGKPPFEGENVLSILHQHATCPVPPITGFLTHLPPGVDSVLEQGLAKDPAARPASCREFVDLLAAQVPASGSYRVPPAPRTQAFGPASRPSPTGPGEVRGLGRSPGASDELPTRQLSPAAVATEPSAPSVGAGSPPSSAADRPPSTLPQRGTSATQDAYVTVHTPAGGPGQLKQWALAALLGAVVALVGFLVLQAMNPRNGEPATAGMPPTQAGAVEAADPPTIGPAAVSGDQAHGTGTPAEREAAPAEREAAGVEPKAQVEEPPAVEVEPARDVPPERESTPPSPRADRSPFSGMRFHALRSFTSRSTERDFRQAQEAARRLAAKGSNPAQASAMQRYADGGLAYLQGDDAIATDNLREVLRNPRFVAFWGPSPLMLLASSEAERDFETWELALGYGDARASAGAELDRLLSAKPDGARYRFARALVHRLDGEHAPVIRYAAPVFQQLQSEDAEATSYLALIIADAYLGLDRGDEAFDWYRRAVRAGGPFRGAVAMRASEAARQIRRPDEAVEFLRLACEAGLRPACERLGANSRRPGGR